MTRSEIIIDELRWALRDCWTPCDCKHPACKRCESDAEARAAISLSIGDPTLTLESLEQKRKRCLEPVPDDHPVPDLFHEMKANALVEIQNKIALINHCFPSLIAKVEGK